MSDAHDKTRIDRLLDKLDARNQAALDAVAGRVNLSGFGVVFVTAPHFVDGEWRDWVPRVRVDGGDPQRLPFGKSFIETMPGRRTLRIESGAPQLGPHDGTDVEVEVPSDGQITLHLKLEFFPYRPPEVTAAPDSADAVWGGCRAGEELP